MRGAGQKVPSLAAESGPLGIDGAIAALAGSQHGVLTRRQLRGLGLSDSSISQRAAAARLHRIHQGVYAVGHRLLTPRGRWMAAVLAHGRRAVLSHGSAAALWEVRAASTAWIDVTVPRTGRRTRDRIRVHRPRTLSDDEVATRHGIPVTPARTVLDLAATLKPDHLNRLLDQVEVRELADYPALDALARAHPGHKGSSKLTEALRTHQAGEDRTKSGLERLLLKLCDDHGLPRPKVNHTLAGKQVDFLFERQKLIVETDSWCYHKTRRAFEADRARDAIHARAGSRTRRFTDHRLTIEPHAVARTIRAALGASP
jgi:very-short-patch-repair endonuclease